jgi:hypothetical protein
MVRLLYLILVRVAGWLVLLVGCQNPATRFDLDSCISSTGTAAAEKVFDAAAGDVAARGPALWARA